METGTINEMVLTRSITKHIRKHNRKLLSGTKVGDDYSSIDFEDKTLICTEGWGKTPFYAWQKAMNNMWVSGGQPEGVRLAFLLPCSVDENAIKSYMSEFNRLADAENIQIMGGNTVVDYCYNAPTFMVNVMGISIGYSRRLKNINPGAQIVMTKYTGILGNDMIVDSKRGTLGKRLPLSYIEDGYFGSQMYSIKKEAAIGAVRDDVYYMHDISTGGLYGALWQLASALNKGVDVNHYDIPIKQHTIEFCEIMNLNPYMMDGTGAALMVTDDGEGLCKNLAKNHIPACVIGKITRDKNRIIRMGNGYDKRFLNPYLGDEINKIFPHMD